MVVLNIYAIRSSLSIGPRLLLFFLSTRCSVLANGNPLSLSLKSRQIPSLFLSPKKIPHLKNYLSLLLTSDKPFSVPPIPNGSRVSNSVPCLLYPRRAKSTGSNSKTSNHIKDSKQSVHSSTSQPLSVQMVPENPTSWTLLASSSASVPVNSEGPN